MMTVGQLKGKIKNLSKGDAKKAEGLMRIFFMERFLERISVSEYKDQFILKGGMLTSSLLGVNLRTTMDVDTSVKALPLTDEDITNFINDIISISLDDGITYKIKRTETIMDGFDYPGVRVHLEGSFESIWQPIKVDVSTDDIITPGAMLYDYHLMFEDRAIKLLSYNIETLLAEKMQTIIARSIANTRLRDYYDVFMLVGTVDFSWDILRDAFDSTCKKRGTVYTAERIRQELELIQSDERLEYEWDRFRKKNTFVKELEWSDVVESINETFSRL